MGCCLIDSVRLSFVPLLSMFIVFITAVFLLSSLSFVHLSFVSCSIDYLHILRSSSLAPLNWQIRERRSEPEDKVKEVLLRNIDQSGKLDQKSIDGLKDRTV